MQLIESCPLSQIQFASLSIFLQLHLNDINDYDDGGGGGGGVHQNRDGAPNTNIILGGGFEQNITTTSEEIKYVEPPMNASKAESQQQQHQHQQSPQYAVVKESLSVLSPLTILPEGACHLCLTSLHVHVMEEFNMRDDFLGVGSVDDDNVDNNDCVTKKIGDVHEHETTTTLRRGSSRVRFHDDTKDGSVETQQHSLSPNNMSEQSGNIMNNNGNNNHIPSFASRLIVRAYHPPPHHINCSLGMTMFYVAMPVEDVTKIAADPKRESHEDAAEAGTFHNCLAVLLPEITLQDLQKMGSSAPSGGGQHRKTTSGIVLITVGITGLAYDLFGVSPIISTLPMRLRECMATLAMVDTTPTERYQTTQSKSSQVVQPQAQQMTPKGKKKTKVGKAASVAATANTQQDQISPSQSVLYDSEYFQRLYMALLATLIDDEDGLLRDHDSIAAIGPSSTQVALKSTIAAGAPIADNIGTVKRKRFTFSRGNKKSGKNIIVESGWEDGGDQPEANSQPTSIVSNADIVRTMAQQLEVLSLVEDDMALPKYSKSATEGTSRTPLSPSNAKSPRRSQVGAGISTGRFGRAPMSSDLAGFDYRPSSYQQVKMHGNGSSSISGTASTSIMANSASDDVSVRTGGDETTTTLSSRFSSSSTSTVPTLSKSKRDSSSSTQKSSRSKFLQRKKKNDKMSVDSPPRGSPGGEGASKPPRFPHQQLQQIQPIYDPFSLNDDNEEYQDEAKSAIEDQSIASDSPVINYQTPTTPDNDDDDTATATSSLDIEQIPRIPEDAPGVVDDGVSLPPLTEMHSDDVPVSHAMDTLLSSSEDTPGDVQSTTDKGVESMPSKDEVAAVQYAKQLDVSLAVNEDLTCEYHRSKLSSLSVEGTVQVRVQTRYKQESLPREQQPTASIPFYLFVHDQSGHIKTLQENNKFAENESQEVYDPPGEVKYIIKVPEEEEYIPVLRYKCDSALRPVPIRVQSRVRIQGKFCRIALQISSNPQNPADLVRLTIIMSVPDGVRGETLQCNPPGGVWNDTKRVVLWCVSELGGGEKFQLQSIFEIDDSMLNGGENIVADTLEFPVLARCQCSDALLSDVSFHVTDISDSFPAEVSQTVARRFRVSHKESNK